MSSVTLVALYTVPEMWFSRYDHRNSPRLLHWMSRLTHPHRLATPLILQWISSLKVLLMDTEWKAWAVPSTAPLESVDGWGKPGTAHRSVAACQEWIREAVTPGWLPCTNVTALSSQPEKVKTLSKCPRGGETEAWSLGHLVSIRPQVREKTSTWVGRKQSGHTPVHGQEKLRRVPSETSEPQPCSGWEPWN